MEGGGLTHELENVGYTYVTVLSDHNERLDSRVVVVHAVNSRLNMKFRHRRGRGKG